VFGTLSDDQKVSLLAGALDGLKRVTWRIRDSLAGFSTLCGVNESFACRGVRGTTEIDSTVKERCVGSVTSTDEFSAFSCLQGNTQCLSV